jgi:hypothetical protein
MGSCYDYSKQIESTILDNIPGAIKARCAIRKIVRTICNLLKINPFESCLLAWLLSRSKYEIDKITNTTAPTDTKSKLVEEESDDKVLMFVLMNAYDVK